MFGRNKNGRSSQREFGKNLLFAVVSVGIFFGSAELLTHFWYVPEKIESEGFFDFDNEKIFKQKTNDQNAYFDVPYSTNSLGHRGSTEISMEKPKNTIRVLVLGDSVAFGVRVLDHETFPYLLEQNLNKHFGNQKTKPSVQVINAAVPGNAPFQEYVDLKRGLMLQPDIIILQFTLNDVRENKGMWVMRNAGFTDVGDSQVEYYDYLFGKATLPAMLRVDHMLKQNSSFYLFLRDIQNRLRFRDITGKNIPEITQDIEKGYVEAMVDDPNNPQLEEEWKVALGWTAKTIELAKNKGIPLVLLATPFSFQISRSMESANPQQILKNFAKEQDVFYIDLLRSLHEQYAESLGEQRSTSEIIAETSEQAPEKLDAFWFGLFFDMCHATPEGHMFIADSIQPIVLKALSTVRENNLGF